MGLLYPVAGVILLVGTPIYLHAVAHLWRIVETERPDWVAARRPDSAFYTGMPRAAVPSASLAVVRLALGSGWRSLNAPQAKGYVWRIRILLPSLLAVLAGTLVAVAVGAP